MLDSSGYENLPYSARVELANIEEELIDKRKKAFFIGIKVKKLREQIRDYMVQHKISVYPSMYELRMKYRPLFLLKTELDDKEKVLQWLELKIILLSKRRKEILGRD